MSNRNSGHMRSSTTLLQQIAAQQGVSETMVRTMTNIMAAESGGNPAADNPVSTAHGLFQFLDSTWNATADADPNDEITRAGRNDPRQQILAMIRFTNDNVNYLRTRANVQNPTAGDIYLAHFLGQGGAANALRQDPSTPLRSVSGMSAVINSNRGIRLANGERITAATFTVGDLRQWANEKMGAEIGGAALYNDYRANRTDNGPEALAADQAERNRRIEQLVGMGYDREAATEMSMDQILGALFLQILLHAFDSEKPRPVENGRDFSIDANRAPGAAGRPQTLPPVPPAYVPAYNGNPAVGSPPVDGSAANVDTPAPRGIQFTQVSDAHLGTGLPSQDSLPRVARAPQVNAPVPA